MTTTGDRLFRSEAHRINSAWRQGYAAGLERHRRISPWVTIAATLGALWLIRRWLVRGAFTVALGGVFAPALTLTVALVAVVVVGSLVVLHHQRIRAARMPLEPPGVVVISEDHGDGYPPF